MIFIDTSAFVAIVLDEPNHKSLIKVLDSPELKYTGSHVRLETAMVLSNRLNMSPHRADELFQNFLNQTKIKTLSFSDEIAKEAVIAFEKFGKGRKHKAQLNLADCMSYAFAKSGNMKMLFVGKDFAHTDIARA